MIEDIINDIKKIKKNDKFVALHEPLFRGNEKGPSV